MMKNYETNDQYLTIHNMYINIKIMLTVHK